MDASIIWWQRRPSGLQNLPPSPSQKRFANSWFREAFTSYIIWWLGSSEGKQLGTWEESGLTCCWFWSRCWVHRVCYIILSTSVFIYEFCNKNKNRSLRLTHTHQYLATWCEESTHWKRPWSWERLKAGGEGDDRGWDGWMASLTQWTWVRANSGR